MAEALGFSVLGLEAEVFGGVVLTEVFCFLAGAAVLAVTFFLTMVFLGPSVVAFFPEVFEEEEVFCEVLDLAALPVAFALELATVLAVFLAGAALPVAAVLAAFAEGLVAVLAAFSEVLTEVFWEVF